MAEESLTLLAAAAQGAAEASLTLQASPAQSNFSFLPQTPSPNFAHLYPHNHMSCPPLIINAMAASPATFDNSPILTSELSIMYPNSSPQANENNARQEESNEMIERLIQLDYVQPC